MQSEIRLRTLIFVLVAAGLVLIAASSWVRAQKPGHGATWLHSAGHHSAGHDAAGTAQKHKKEKKEKK